jgi:hypothetical protein
MPDDRSKPYNVGFGKPPKPTQFRKGLSGNPKGRPKGSRNLETVLEETLEEKVVINENGVRRTVTKLEAAVKQLVNKAASGDLSAVRQLLARASSAEEEVTAPPAEPLDQNDQKVMENVLKRIRKSTNREGNEIQ